MASAAGVQGADSAKLMDELIFTPSDFLNNLGAGMFAGMNSSTSSATSGLTTGNWGTHNANIDMAGGASLSFKQVALFGGLALFGWWLIRKIGGK